MKGFKACRFIPFLIILLTACSTSVASSATQSPEPAISPTQTPTIKASPTPEIKEIRPENFGFPVSFEGPYAVKKVGYKPCYHWDPTTFDKSKLNSDNWWEQFHAGDLYTLNNTKASRDIIILSPIDGIIQNVKLIEGVGLEINIRSDYFYHGKRVFVDIVHSNVAFPGDDANPSIKVGSQVKKGQPIAISNTSVFHGVWVQEVDIGLRIGHKNANPIYPDWDPDSYIDPYQFLEDDLQYFNKFIYIDRTLLGHCKLSGHY